MSPSGWNSTKEVADLFYKLTGRIKVSVIARHLRHNMEGIRHARMVLALFGEET